MANTKQQADVELLVARALFDPDIQWVHVDSETFTDHAVLSDEKRRWHYEKSEKRITLANCLGYQIVRKDIIHRGDISETNGAVGDTYNALHSVHKCGLLITKDGSFVAHPEYDPLRKRLQDQVSNDLEAGSRTLKNYWQNKGIYSNDVYRHLVIGDEFFGVEINPLNLDMTLLDPFSLEDNFWRPYSVNIEMINNAPGKRFDKSLLTSLAEESGLSTTNPYGGKFDVIATNVQTQSDADNVIGVISRYQEIRNQSK